ncbi:MAG: PAS domain S-box protein, partial [candidate division Zixibacteria bacterium]|nr:PAS domain S-box protein [candidate division Zixibacteria bacterium]
RAEEALQKSEEKFQKAFESGPDPISISRLADGRIVEVNASFEKVLGYTRQEVIGKTSLELGIFKDPADREVLKNILQKESRVRDIEIEFRRKSGEILTCRVSAELIDLRGETHLLAIPRDITESKRAEEKLKAKEKSLSHAQQIAHMGSWEYSFETRKAKWSDEAYSIFEFNPNEPVLYYETYLESIHPDERAYVDKIYTDSIRDMTSGEIEYRIVMKDGRIKYIRDRWENLNDDNGKPLRSFGTFLDITDRVRHETEMKERKERLKLVKDIAMEITSDMSIEEVVTNALEGIFNMFPDYRVSYGVRIDENLYRFMASVGPSRLKNIKGTNFNITNAPEFVEALAKGYVVTNDILQDEMVMPLRCQLKELQIRAMINTPVVHAAWLVGVLWLDSDVPRTWSDHEITTLEDVSRYLAVAVKNAQLIEERKKASEELKAESAELIEKNIALNQVLEHLEKDKQNYKEQISESIESLLMPIVKKLKKRDGNLSPKDISLLENSLDAIVGKEINVFRKNLVKLSPRELDICELIREGKSSKEISSFLNLSTLTVHKHRESIRSKLQLKNKSTNLSAYLRTREFLTDSTQSLRN